MTSALTLPADKFDASMTFVRPSPAPTRAPLEKLAVLPGFNTRVKDADYSERVKAITESILQHGFYDDKPFSVVMLPGDETIYIFDGEHRFDAARAASLDIEFPDGLPIAFAKDGVTVKDLTVHLVHGNAGANLNQVEFAAVVRRLKSLGLKNDEIAKEIGKTARHVDNLLVLSGASQQVKKAVAGGQIAAAEAVKLVRKDPKLAAEKVAEAVKAAEEKGKKKATPKTMRETARTPTKLHSMSINFPVGQTAGTCLKELAGMIRGVITVGEEDKITEDALVRFSVQVVDHEAIAARDARQKEREAAAAKKAEEKAARDKQRADAKAVADAMKADAAKKALEAKAAKADAAKKAKAAKAKTAAPKNAKPISAAEAKEKAKAHLGGGKAAPKAKTASKPAKAATPKADTAEAAKPKRTKKSAPAATESDPNKGL